MPAYPRLKMPVVAIGEHQAGGDQRIDRPADRARHDVTDELIHGRHLLPGVRNLRRIACPVTRDSWVGDDVAHPSRLPRKGSCPSVFVSAADFDALPIAVPRRGDLVDATARRP